MVPFFVLTLPEQAIDKGNRYNENAGKPDYVKRFRQSYKEGMALIDSLIPFIEEAPEVKYAIRGYALRKS